MTGLKIQQIPVLCDNYVYLLRDEATGKTAVVDPAVADPVISLLEDAGLDLDYIFNTHHHGDHVGGNLALKSAFGCTIVGARSDAPRIPGIDVEVGDGQSISLGDQQARVIDVPGHTRGHIAYWFEGAKALFCGDTLFSLGCGRLFEGTAGQMWHSLSRLRDLPGDTRVYCAHEYTQSNARFALTIDPENVNLVDRAREVDDLRERGLSSVPSTLAAERLANPFLRADDPGLARSMGLDGAAPEAVFAEIRKRKDSF